MGVQDLVRFVLPKDDRFFDFLEEQARLAHEGASALAALKDAKVSDVKDQVHAIEKKGDKVVHALEDALAQTFVTPLDREDIHKLSSLLDDILDRAYAAASAFDMFCVERPSDEAMEFFGLLEKTCELLAGAMPSLRRHDFEKIREAVRELKLREKEGDALFRGTMKKLFSDGNLDARALVREKEIIEILENAVDTCEDAGEFLANLAVKHG